MSGQQERDMTKPTGRPRGRPKTLFYTTLMARVPDELVAQVKRYAGLKRQSLSVVIRDALTMLLEAERFSANASDRHKEVDIVSDTKEEQPDIVSDIKEAVLSVGQPALLSGTKAALSRPVPAFNQHRYYLGRLCPRGHEYYGTGHSLRAVHSKNSCVECKNENTRKRRQAKRQAQHSCTRGF
jgi:hypothetical protein